MFDRLKQKRSTSKENPAALVLQDIHSDLEDFLIGNPFRGIDDIPYGTKEVYMFSSVEYMAWLILRYDAKIGKDWYEKSLLSRCDKKSVNLLILYFLQIQEMIQGNVSKAFKMELSHSDRLNLIIYLCAFEPIKRLCLGRVEKEYAMSILRKGDFEFVLDFFNSDGSSDDTILMDNYIRFVNFLVDCVGEKIMPKKRK